MNAPAPKLPGSEQPIDIEPTLDRVVITFAGRLIADSARALTLREASYPPVQYIPREDARMDLFAKAPHHTHCPYKGDASYFTLKVGDQIAENAVWSYEQPYPAMRKIAGMLAFYPNKVGIELKKNPTGA